MAEEPAVVLKVDLGVGTITLNRPKQKNSLGAEIINGLGDSLKSCFANDEVRIVVLTNSGNTFCAGANLKDTKEKPRYNLVEIFQMMQSGPKVILGRIAGHCTGGGVGLASACDISVIGNTAEVGFTEVRIGVAPAIISVVCLPKMRRADAAELMLSGEKISGSRAAQAGLINYSVPPEELDAKVAEIAGKLVRGGPDALADTKKLVYQVPSMPVEEAFSWTAKMSLARFASAEAKQGIAAFNKRIDAPWVPKSSL